MDSEQFSALLLLIFLLFVYGLFSAAREAFYSLSSEQRDRLKGADDRRSLILQSLLKSPRSASLSILLGRRIALAACAGAGWWLWCAFDSRLPVVWSFVVLPFVFIAFGSFVMGRSFRQEPLLYAHRISYIIWIFSKAVFPLRWGLHAGLKAILSMLSIQSPSEDEDVLEREYLGIVEMGRREGVVESDEHRLIHKVFDFGDYSVAKVMTPRTDMFSLPLDSDLGEAIRSVKNSGYSRVPVYGNNKDDIVGIVYAKDFIRLRVNDSSSKPKSLQALLSPPYFVPTQKGIDELFREFKKRKLHMAICVDEYGGVAGLVTMEDLLEELFGEIYDEYDLETRQWESLEDGSYMVSGKMDLESLSELLDAEMEAADCRTLAGFVLKLLGRLPLRGESVRWGDFSFVVEKVLGTRIQTVRVERTGGRSE